MSNEPNRHSTFAHNKNVRASVLQSDTTHKSRKFSWSACVNYVTNKLTKKSNKSSNQKIRLSQSYQDFDQKQLPIAHESFISDSAQEATKHSLWKGIQHKSHERHHQALSPTPSLPPPSLSPPPRQTKSKRDSCTTQQIDTNAGSFNIPIDKQNRRPLLDPTLTPRVRPLTIKTKRQPSLLRLSLDADLIQSPDGDNDSLITFRTDGSHTPTYQQSVPFRNGTLGTIGNSRLSSGLSHPPPPPLPPLNIPLEYTNASRLDSQLTNTSSSTISQFTLRDSSALSSPIDIDDEPEEQKLTLKERRRRRSPLSMPNTESLTLALEELMLDDQEHQRRGRAEASSKRKTYDANAMSNHSQDQTWYGQQFSIHTQSRKEAMLTLEGKKARAISLQPIARIQELDDHFEKDREQLDIVRDKAQYDAIVAGATLHRGQLSIEEKRQSHTSLRARSSSDTIQPLLEHAESVNVSQEVLPRNATGRGSPISTNKVLLFAANGDALFGITPETPPHHKQTAPSLISAPSTPNSIDSSVVEQDDYISHQQHRVSLLVSST